jgi:hypothetical protein
VAAAEAKQITAEHRVKNLSVALAEVESKLVDLESRLAAVLEERQRAANVAEIEKHAVDLAAAATDLDRALESTVTLTAKLTPWCTDATGLNVFTGSARVEVAAAAAVLLQLLKMHANARPVSLAKPAPPPQPLPKPAPTTHVTALKAVAWLDHQGMVQTAAAGADIALPVKTAQRAIAINAVCEMNDPRRKTAKERIGFKIGVPLRRNCIDLSDNMPPDTEDPLAPAPIMRSSVEPLFKETIGPPRVIQVPSNPALPATASRTIKDDKKP